MLASEVAGLAASEMLIPSKKKEHKRWLWFLENTTLWMPLSNSLVHFFASLYSCIFCSVYCEDFSFTGLAGFWHAFQPAGQLTLAC